MKTYKGYFCSMFGTFELFAEANSAEEAEQKMSEGLPEGTQIQDIGVYELESKVDGSSGTGGNMVKGHKHKGGCCNCR